MEKLRRKLNGTTAAVEAYQRVLNVNVRIKRKLNDERVKALTQVETSAGLEKEWESEGVGGDGSQAHLREERKGVERRGVRMGSDESVVGEDVWGRNAGEEGAGVR